MLLRNLLLAFYLLFSIPANAAFPIHNEVSIAAPVAAAGTIAATTQKQSSKFSKILRPAEDGAAKPKTKSHLVAILMGVFMLFGLPGIQRFYLGYNWQGLLQLLATVFIYIGVFILALGALSAWSATIPLGTLVAGLTFMGIGSGLWVWAIVDFFRICFKTLKPKNGEYRN